ncbi:S8 family serine peptidase, partial [Candidatus Woesearchaeota archaeon]|nr:S8 family serine peptidase [Candidatus Woesearchaeota archaeon]
MNWKHYKAVNIALSACFAILAVLFAASFFPAHTEEKFTEAGEATLESSNYGNLPEEMEDTRSVTQPPAAAALVHVAEAKESKIPATTARKTGGGGGESGGGSGGGGDGNGDVSSGKGDLGSDASYGSLQPATPAITPSNKQPATVPAIEFEKVGQRPEIVEKKLLEKKGEEEIEVIITLNKNIRDEPSSPGIAAATTAINTEAQQLETLGAKIEGAYPIGNIVVAKIKPSELIELTRNGDVTGVFENREVHAALDESVPQITAQAFWDAGFKGEGVKIAILDTGIDSSHPMLTGKIVAEKAFTGEDHTTDFNGHGTHVAGTAAGTKTKGGSYDGVAPNALLMNGKVLNDAGSGSTAGIVAGINWAVDPDGNPATDDGADIISMSLGGKYNEPFDPMSMAIKDAVAEGVLVIVASGNCGACNSCGGYKGVTTPGNSPWAFSVGAVDKGNEAACFSGGGVVDGVGIKPDVTAPGVGIKSSVPGGYSAYQGTSMATPHVAGAAALLLSKNNKFTPQQIRMVLENTAADFGTEGKDTSYGYGVINLSAALNANAAIIAKDSVSGSILAGETILENITIYNFGSDKMQVSVTHDAWIKIEGLPSESFQLEPATNKSFSYRITGTEAGTGHHDGKIEMTTDAPNLKSKSIMFSIDIFESTAPSFSKADFSTEVFSGEEIPVEVEVTDNGDVVKVSAEAISSDGSFPTIASGLERLSAQRWKGLLKMPAVSSATKGRIKITATDNEGHASALEKEIMITDVITTIQPKEIVQGMPVDFSAVFVNTQDKAIDVLAEFTINDSFGLTVFRDVDGSLTLPTGMKAQFTSQWTTEKYGTYDAIISIKKTDGTLIANRSETLVISLPKWGEISAINLPETAVKGTNLSYSIDFRNTGPVPYEAIAIVSLIDERENTRIVMESEEKTIPAGGTATLSDSNKVEIDGGNYTAAATVSYGNREEFESKPFTMLMPPILKLESLDVQKSAEYKTPTIPVSFSLSNNGEVKAFAEFTISVINDNSVAYSEKINGTQIMPGETALLSNDLDILSLQPGSYRLNLNVSYEGQMIEAESAFEIIDSKAPVITEVKAADNLRRLEPLTVKVAANDESRIANKTIILQAPASGSRAERNISATEDYATFFETAAAGTYQLEISACDIYGNCNSALQEVSVSDCDGKKLLVINNTIPESSAAVFMENSQAECTYTFDTDKAEAPAGEYLNEFDAVVWSSGSRTKEVPKEYQELLLNYAGKGKVLIEGTGIAFRHRNDDFMQNVTHSTLKEELDISITNDSGSSAQSLPPMNMSEAAAHYITMTAPEHIKYESPRHPDSVIPANGGTGIFRWADAGHSAVAYEDIATGAKSVFLAFDANEIEPEKKAWLAGKSLEWLLLGKAEEDIAVSLNYGYLVEGDNQLEIVLTAKTTEPIQADIHLIIDGNEAFNTSAETTEDGLTIPAAIQLQTGTRLAVVKAITQKPENNYENNRQNYTLTVAPGMPDIKIEGINSHANNGTVNANATVSNMGGIAAETTVTLYVDGDAANSTNLLLEPGEEEKINLAANAAPGVHTIKITAETASDYNTSNNELSEKAYLCSGKKILLVNDNLGDYTTEQPSSADEFVRILQKGGYCIDEWDITAEGSIPAEHLNNYDAIIWSRGNYFGGSPDEITTALNSYKGPALIEGADIGMEHSEDAILGTVFGTAFGTDLIVSEATQLLLKPEPITEGLETLEINGNGSPYPDSMQPTSATVAAEWPEGGAAITENEPGNHRRTAMYAFSINGITEQNARDTLVLNTIWWLLIEPNELPEKTVLEDDIGIEGLVIKMKEGQTKKLSIIASDPDNDTLTFKWLLNGTPVSETDTFTFSPAYNESGSYNLTIIVSDGIAEARAYYTIEVLDYNTAPALAPIGNHTVNENEKLEFSISASDNEDTTLFLNATGLPEGASFDNETGMFSWVPTFEQSGIYEAIFNVSDGLISATPMHDYEAINITVVHVNRAPSIKSVEGNLSVNETETTSIIVNAEEPDKEDTLQFSINDTRFAANAAAQNQFEWDTTYDDAGTYVVNVTVTDGFFYERAEVAITVFNVNRAPQIDTIENQSINENERLTVNAKALEPDKEDTVAFTLSNPSGAEGVEFDSASGTLEWTPTFEQAGIYEMSITASDGLLEDSTQFNITVLNVNRIPEIVAASPQETIYETEKAETAIIASDPDGDNVAYFINDSRFEQNAPGEFEWQTGYEDAGEYYLQLNATDGSLTATHEAKVTVLNLNRNPIIESPENMTVKENSTLTFEVKANDPDKEDSISWMIEYPPSAAGIEFNEGKFNWTPNFEQAGSYNVSFSVSDGQTTTTTSINITVLNTNRPPVIEMLMIEPSGLVMNEGETKTFYPALNDADEDELMVEWKVDGSVAAATPVFEFSPDYDSTGKHTIQLTVKDDEATAKKDVDIQVLNVNRAPNITSEPVRQATEEQAYTYTATANDSDIATETGDKLTFSLTEAPTGMAIDTITGEITWTPTNQQSQGTHDIIIMVTDTEGSTTTQTYTINVANVNDEPTITSTPTTTATEETEYTYNVESQDDDYKTITPTEKHTYTLTQSPEGMNIN